MTPHITINRRHPLCIVALLLAVMAAWAPLSAHTVTLNGQPLPADALQSAAIPLLTIDTEGAEEPTFDIVEAPDGYWGAGITNATKVPGRLTISLAGATIYDSGSYEKKKSGITLKVRGNTSASQEQTPYKIKLQKSADLLGRTGSKDYSDKDFILISSDRINTKIMVGLMVNDLMDNGWTPAWRTVNVVVNGSYRGLYLLCESVERNPNCRIDVDKNTGFIFENDAYWWNEDLYFTNAINHYTNYTLKYPDPEDISEAQKALLTERIAVFEQSLADGTYPQQIDVRSWALWLIGHDLLGDIDAGGSNMFLTLYDDTPVSKLKMGPLWDFDHIEHERCEGRWAFIHTDRNAFVFPLLLESANAAFVEAYQQAWQELSTTLLERINSRLDSYLASDEGQAIDAFLPYRDAITHYSETSLEAEIAAHKAWFARRVEWLQQAIPAIASTHIDTPRRAADASSTAVYSLSGMQMRADSHQGVVIKGGKKVVSR